jgi:hypothetical protein
MGTHFNHVPLPTLDTNDITQLSRYPKHGLDSLDAGENQFFARDLEYKIPEMLEFEYARISARSVFPIDNRAGPGAEVITLRQMTKVGVAKIVTDYANDIPLSNVFTEETKSNVRSIADAAEWSIQEIRASAMAGMQLDRDKSDAAREAMLRKENKIAWEGDATHGLAGFFTDTNIPRFTVPAGVGGVPWSLKTGAEIVDDMNATVNPISENTGGVESPNKLVIPRAQYNLAHTTRMADGTDTTALQYFVNNSPYIASMSDVIPVDDIAGLGAGGVDAMFAYDFNSSKLVMNIPLDIEQFPPQERDMVTRVIYHMRFGGVLIKKPLSIRIAEGI